MAGSDYPRRALLSVSDKTGLEAFAARLASLGYELVSTGGTAAALRASGLAVTEVAELTGFPEMLDGRVKTLHPKVHGAILARLDLPAHRDAIDGAGISPISLVVVNLYPFREVSARPGVTLDEAVENIDIGGPAMVRAAAKNYPHVGIVTDPGDYSCVLDELAASGVLSDATRFELARKAFSHTAAYDGAISNYLGRVAAGGDGDAWPAQINFSFSRVSRLRYGENPHQAAAFYRDLGSAASVTAGTIAGAVQRQGKELSYNNIADADAAWECVRGFEADAGAVACVIVKHANPCGVAVGADTAEAYRRAFATDPTSAFGGIIAFNRALDEAGARAVSGQFAEVVIAPEVLPAALAVLAAKPSLRVLETGYGTVRNTVHLQRVGGGVLVQGTDLPCHDAAQLKVVTRRAPTPAELTDLLFAWKVAKFVKSNAIVFAGGAQTLGVGAGQMSRIDSVRIARHKAGEAGLDLTGSCVASDAFFPFRDGLDALVAAGARAVIQPGGSVRDAEVIAAADDQGVAMLFTGIRHFRH
ncbi:MAG: bifunctional phosphoribosylaminoimidazolecarboxamide formyltransferase/IMP cyclohydrolase [Rhodocyclaceae bacterium]|nr:bifunctional phosphoribosylaminoimidazolecarboxamide formyltransferase/IMP cyclohydrolase [Rhodocyclaceae bacterium]MCA3093464.1 bifunctional phosphoribosylaminoimidazolecarboxamide formyltransferase/IMP cyclohydrolase [Rhodocyclaceae bacterium]MCA3096281.1 bifunctional phosphoribosylaminoimidazolecarboxamide formyltransferase/IMP cyclohydrolase [Rhodocyclaceae bacterium]MCA3101272.1 bifunctional phosphoribosylaminoimidazolecarboxamide formyltransferase/IMP cyclohydrolase [Rhodocyclaceae bact